MGCWKERERERAIDTDITGLINPVEGKRHSPASRILIGPHPTIFSAHLFRLLLSWIAFTFLEFDQMLSSPVSKRINAATRMFTLLTVVPLDVPGCDASSRSEVRRKCRVPELT